VIGTLAIDVWDVIHLELRAGTWAGCGPAQSLLHCTRCNSPPINSQCTNFTLFDISHQLPLNYKGSTASDKVSLDHLSNVCMRLLLTVDSLFSQAKVSHLNRSTYFHVHVSWRNHQSHHRCNHNHLLVHLWLDNNCRNRTLVNVPQSVN